MMTRGEVALIVAQKGLEVGVVDPVYFTAVILLIVVSSVATPLALKALFTKMPAQDSELPVICIICSSVGTNSSNSAARKANAGFQASREEK